MMQSFACKETEKIWYEIRSHKLPGAIQRVALRKLIQLDSAASPQDLIKPPGNRLEKLKGHKGFFSIRINDQWRIVFCWGVDGPFDVAIVDYH